MGNWVGVVAERIRLKDLDIGEYAEISGYSEGDYRYRHRLLSLGLTRGARIRLVKIAPFGDPVEIEVRGVRLSLRKSEADVLDLRRTC
jgi:ferrous iron transport protein A